MPTRQQRIKLERARQQQAAAARQQQPSRPLGAEAIDAIERDLATFSQLPGVRQGLQFVGGAVKVVNETVLDPLRYASEEQLAGREADPGAALLGHVVRGFEYGVQKGEEGGAAIAEQLNVDPRLGGFLGGTAVETLLTAGAGTVAKKAVKAVDVLTPPTGMVPAMAGGSPSITPRFFGGKIDLSPQVMEITVDPKFRAPGMVQDVAQQPEFRGALDRRAAALDEVRSNIARREAQGKTAAKYKKELAGKGSTLDYDPNDPIVFEKNRYKVYDPLDPQRTAHQHHLFAKAQSYPFVEKMEELISKGVADEDDLVNMFAWADMLDVTMGNTRKNMLDAPGRAHIAAAPGSTELDKALNIHAILQEFSLEIPGKQVREMVKDAKNATELMDTFNNYIVESVKPQKRVAQRIVEDFITRHRSTLPKDQLSMFDDLVSKLGGRYKPR